VSLIGTQLAAINGQGDGLRSRWPPHPHTGR
jgi:hypothetical protein